MKITSTLRRTAFIAALTFAAGLAGCYVVPIQPPAQSSTLHVPMPAPAPVTFSARLYPSNEQAAAYGTVMATVTNDLNGRGHFTTSIGGETFSGEATRVAGSSREGLANGAGSRGSFINCRYTMNSPTLGTGTCRMSSGAAFVMHVGS
ncbi:MAG TPA: hypothetical protein VLI46_10110 [Ramlibacter sp.]|nr:hypothetical protein [Ramlibacter sp.]